MTSTTCDFTLTKRNDLGEAYAYVFLYSFSSPIMTQTVVPGNSIKFNNHGRLASIAWLAKDELTMLKDGLFEIEFSINYQAAGKNVQVELHINNIGVGVAFGGETGTNQGLGTIAGKYNIRLYKNDKLKLVGKTNSFTIRPAGTLNEIMATWSIKQV